MKRSLQIILSGAFKIKTLVIVPMLLANIYCLTAANYYSTGSTDISLTTSWNTATNGTGSTPSAIFNTSGDVFFIQNGHSMTCTGAQNISAGVTLEIQNGGVLTCTSTSTAQLVFNASATFKINSGGKYVHNGGSPYSSLLAGIEIFDANSTFEIQGGTTGNLTPTTGPGTPSDGGTNVGFGHLTFTGMPGNVNSSGTLTRIRGNLTLNYSGSSVGTKEFRLTGATALTLQIDGDLIITDGTLNLGNNTANPIVNLLGNFSLAAGNLTFTGTATTAPTATINFAKSGTQTFTKTGGAITLSNTTRIITFNVNSGATLDLMNVLDQSPTTNRLINFSVANGGGIIIRDANGIASGTTASGNIQVTGTRTFNTGANYEYKGSAAQVTGTGLPATVNNLTINNAAGVTLSANTTVAGTLSLTSGALTLNGNSLTMSSGSQLKGTGTLIGNYSHPTGSTLSPGFSPGTTTITGNLTNTGDWAIELAGTTAGTQYDQVLVSGTATLTSGTVNVTLLNGYDPTVGSTFVILDAASLSGTFTAINLPTLASGKVWATPVYDNAAGTVTLVVNAALAIELTSLTAKTQSNGNLIEWTTATEHNNAYFNIERSANGVDFTVIGTVKGNGTTSKASNYSFTDETPLSISYYRLRSTDFNGKSELSNVVTVSRSLSDKIKVQPTLATDKVFVTTEGVVNNTSFSIINLLGHVVQQGLLSERTELSISQLPVGTYWLKVGKDVVKFVKL